MCACYLKFKKISMPSDILESTLRKMIKYTKQSEIKGQTCKFRLGAKLVHEKGLYL